MDYDHILEDYDQSQYCVLLPRCSNCLSGTERCNWCPGIGECVSELNGCPDGIITITVSYNFAL